MSVLEKRSTFSRNNIETLFNIKSFAFQKIDADLHFTPPPPPEKKTIKTKKKTKTRHNKTKTYLEFHYYPYDTERISMYMSQYRLLILLGAISDFITILIFYSTQES